MNNEEAIIEVARLVKSAGGRALLVGGCVRDELNGIVPKDFDIEVFGIRENRLQALLESSFIISTSTSHCREEKPSWGWGIVPSRWNMNPT